MITEGKQTVRHGEVTQVVSDIDGIHIVENAFHILFFIPEISSKCELITVYKPFVAYSTLQAAQIECATPGSLTAERAALVVRALQLAVSYAQKINLRNFIFTQGA